MTDAKRTKVKFQPKKLKEYATAHAAWAAEFRAEFPSHDETPMGAAITKLAEAMENSFQATIDDVAKAAYEQGVKDTVGELSMWFWWGENLDAGFSVDFFLGQASDDPVPGFIEWPDDGYWGSKEDADAARPAIAEKFRKWILTGPEKA